MIFTFYLLLLSTVLGYAVIQMGGTRAADWNLCLSGLGLLSLLFWFPNRKRNSAPPLDRGLRFFVVVLPLYILFQLIPIPAALLRILSPERATVLASLAPAVPIRHFAPLSVAPAETLTQLFRVVAYVLVFLMARELAWRSPTGPWRVVFPLIAIAATEAAIGLLRYAGDVDPSAHAHGTYVNKNHFAGLLEMVLPLAAIYPVPLLRRGGPIGLWSARSVIKACGAVSVAALILIAILCSSSRLGFVAALCALFVVGTAGVITRLSVRKKWLAGASLGVLCLLAFIFLPPDELIRQYGKLSSIEQIIGEGRLSLWAETLRLIAAYPVLGCGLGGYESAFAKYQVTFPTQRVDYAHNDYLQLLAELGLLGSVIIGGLVIKITVVTLRAATTSSGTDEHYAAVGCMGAFAAILVHSLADFNLYIPANGLVLAWIAGVGASAASRETIVVSRTGAPPDVTTSSEKHQRRSIAETPWPFLVLRKFAPFGSKAARRPW